MWRKLSDIYNLQYMPTEPIEQASHNKLTFVLIVISAVFGKETQWHSVENYFQGAALLFSALLEVMWWRSHAEYYALLTCELFILVEHDSCCELQHAHESCDSQ